MLGYSYTKMDPESFFIAAFFMVIIVLIQYLSDKKRKEEFDEYCKNKGLVYYEKCSQIPDCDESFKFNIVKDYFSYEYKSIMKGSTSGINFCIFVFHYFTGGRNGDYYRTICMLDKPGNKFPKFYIRKRRLIIDWIKEKFGEQNIIFDDDKVFSKRFIVQGPDEDKIRKFFTPEFRKAFIETTKHYKYEYEASNKYFIAYLNRDLELDERIDLANNLLKIYASITSLDKVEKK